MFINLAVKVRNGACYVDILFLVDGQRNLDAIMMS